MVAGQIAIEQLAVEPVGTGTPMHLAHMHQVAGQPHAGMVVQQAGGIQGLHRLVHHGHAGVAPADIGRQRAGIGIIWQQPLVQRLQDALAAVLPNMAEIGPPAQLKHKLVLYGQWMLLGYAGQHLAQGHKTVGEVGRQARYCTIQRVAGAGIGGWLHGRNAGPGGSKGRCAGFKHLAPRLRPVEWLQPGL